MIGQKVNKAIIYANERLTHRYYKNMKFLSTISNVYKCVQ